MRLQDLTETSGYSLRGSYTTDLIYSKVWLLDELKKISPSYDVMYILGSWYSNLSIINELTRTVVVSKYINVDKNPQWVYSGDAMLAYVSDTESEPMAVDVNTLDYRQLTPYSVVVNTSIHDIIRLDWWNNIPDGTLVVLQSRDNNPKPMPYETLTDLQNEFHMAETLFAGSVDLQDPETAYTRNMLIGIK